MRPEAPVRLAHVAQEGQRVVRASRGRARREAHPDHRRIGIAGVDRVVAGCEQPLVRGTGDVTAGGVLLGRPVEEGVRLVPHDVVVDPPLRHRLGDRLRPRAERRRVVLVRIGRVEGEHDVDPGGLRDRRRTLEERELADRGRIGRIPRERPAVLGEVRARQLLIEPCAAVVGELRRVVGDPPGDRRRVHRRRGASVTAARRRRSSGDHEHDASDGNRSQQLPQAPLPIATATAPLPTAGDLYRRTPPTR